MNFTIDGLLVFNTNISCISAILWYEQII